MGSNSIVAVALLYLSFILNCSASSFSKIQQRFKESLNQPRSQSQARPQSLSLDAQIEQYSKMHSFPYFTNMKGNPQLDVSLILKKDGKTESSVYFQGRQLSKYLLQVTVLHKGDHYNHAKESIHIQIINTATKEIVLAAGVRHIRLFQTDIDSDLYQLRVSHEWVLPSSASNKQAIQQLQDELQKHISMKMEIIDRNTKPEDSKADELMKRMGELSDKQDKIFLDSLQGWDQVKMHQKLHQASEERVYFNACVQILTIVAVYIFELLMLRKMIKTNNGVI